jgi:hypothetical protein
MKGRRWIGNGQEQGAEVNSGPKGSSVNRRLKKNCIMSSIICFPKLLLLLLYE